MKLAKVLILHKKSTFQLQAIEYREPRFVKLLAEEHAIVTRVKQAHDEHTNTLNKLQEELSKRHIDYKILARSGLTESVNNIDLLITVGGDGTFLDASHFLKNIPILGVNSAASSSFGHFCYANINNLAKVLDEIESDKLKPYKLTRLELNLNGELLPDLALNELLIAHSNPAGTSRYFIQVGDIQEEQRSSGIWIGTASGSTGSIRSAGGKVFPITDPNYEYLVREPCLRPGETRQLLSGILPADQSIILTSQMRTGAIFLDGQHINHSFSLGDELIIKPSSQFLNAYVSASVNDIFIN